MTFRERIGDRWPRLMKRRTAAEYLDVTEQAFEREIFAGRMPASVTFGGQEHWDKASLEAAVDRLTGEATASRNLRDVEAQYAEIVPDYRREHRRRYGRE